MGSKAEGWKLPLDSPPYCARLSAISGDSNDKTDVTVKHEEVAKGSPFTTHLLSGTRRCVRDCRRHVRDFSKPWRDQYISAVGQTKALHEHRVSRRVFTKILQGNISLVIVVNTSTRQSE